LLTAAHAMIVGTQKWVCEAMLVCKTIGAAATWNAYIMTELELPAAYSATTQKITDAAPTLVARTDGSAPTLTLRVRMATAVASNTLTVEGSAVEQVKA
jgi:hypothetical protein